MLKTTLSLDIFVKKEKHNKEFMWMLPRQNPNAEQNLK